MGMATKTAGSTRVLVALSSYGTSHDPYLSQVIREYQSMSFDADIVVLSNLPKKVAPGVEVIVVDLRGKDPWSLLFAHRQILAQRLNDYDLFIHCEDDVLIRESNIRAFLEASGVLQEDELPGFFRYEEGPQGKRSYPDVRACYHWQPESVHLRSPYTTAFFTNEHSGCYVLTRGQLRKAIESGGFLVKAHKGRYDAGCSAATDPFTQCGLRKVICISHLDDFLIHHLSNRYVGISVGVDDGELRRQIKALLQVQQNGSRTTSLLETETKLSERRYSKNYYEPVRPEVMAAIAEGVRSVLSVGCEWGATEVRLAEKGLRVSAVPLDPVIAGAAGAKGVEIINCSLAQAPRYLANREFDGLILSNVLHLVPNPAETLSSFAALLGGGGMAIVVAPHTARMAAAWKMIRHGENLRDLASYQRTGVQRVSRQVILSWFRAAGMRVEKVTQVLGPLAQKLSRVTLGMFDQWIADEFVAVARKHTGTLAR
jgi:2-polyprenyl-3-methyl-5-hydroxy-6-metoxy-1,4-benzoquinol methylase